MASELSALNILHEIPAEILLMICHCLSVKSQRELATASTYLRIFSLERSFFGTRSRVSTLLAISTSSVDREERIG